MSGSRLAEQHPEWALGFADETWWSRFAVPGLHAWAEPQRPLRLVEQAVATDDPDPKALAAYGLYLPADNEVLLRFVDGRPVSALTTQFLAWCCGNLATRGTAALLLVWDNAGWHISKEVRAWVRGAQPGSQTRRGGGAAGGLPVARAESLAQPHRAEMGPRQAPGGRTQPPADRARDRRARLCRVGVRL